MHPSRTGVRSSIGAWLLALLAVLVSIPTTQAEPTFDETIDFIRRTVEEHGQFRNIAGGGRIRVKLAQVLGRRLRFRTIATDGIPGSLDRSESTEFSLADLDPDATHVRLWFAGERQAFAVWMTDAGRVSGVRRWQDANEEMPPARFPPAGSPSMTRPKLRPSPKPSITPFVWPEEPLAAARPTNSLEHPLPVAITPPPQ